MATKRTTLRSTAGNKLYAVRDPSGQFEDIQTYKRAHGRDLRTTSAAEAEAREAREAKAAGAEGDTNETKETSMSETVKDMAKAIADKVSETFTTVEAGALEMSGMAPAKKASGRKSSAKKSTGRKSSAKKAGGRKSTKKSTGRKSGVKKATGRKSAAKKSTGRKSSARKSSRKS